MIKHILFDCDGVLVDTEIVAAHVMVEAMQKLGANITVDHYLRNLSGSTFSAIMDTYFGDSFNGKEREVFMEEAEQKTIAQLTAVDGIEKTLQSISIPKSIVSNSKVWYVKHVTKKTGIQQYFTGHIFSSELVKNAKPSPDVYNLAKSTLKLGSNQLIAIEDSISGVKSAVTADIPVIGFTGASHILQGHGDKLRKLGTIEIASNMDELNLILEKLINNHQ